MFPAGNVYIANQTAGRIYTGSHGQLQHQGMIGDIDHVPTISMSFTYLYMHFELLALIHYICLQSILGQLNSSWRYFRSTRQNAHATSQQTC